jgi:two-component system sensor histidine kinase KdpD
LSETNREALYSEIGIAGFRLNRHVENLLNMSRLEAGILKPKPDWCDVNELIHGIIQDNKEASVDHQVIFDQDEQLPLFKIDSGLVEQIISNILYNALQHTPRGTEINIKVRSRKDFCLFIVSDNGKGFPEEEKNKVFDKFYRISKHASSGTGLGLSIVRGFTEVLGGTIELQNNKTGGASFLIEIPANTIPINGLNHEHSGNTHH